MALSRKGHIVEVNPNVREDIEKGVGPQMSPIRPQMYNLSFILIAPVFLMLFHRGGHLLSPLSSEVDAMDHFTSLGTSEFPGDMRKICGFFHNAFNSS